MSIDTRNKDYAVLLIGAPEDTHEALEHLSRLFDWTIMIGHSTNPREHLREQVMFLLDYADALVYTQENFNQANDQSLVLMAQHLGLDILSFAEAVDMYGFIHGEQDCD